jgi:hypothetical protein
VKFLYDTQRLIFKINDTTSRNSIRHSLKSFDERELTSEVLVSGSASSPVVCKRNNSSQFGKVRKQRIAIG